MRALATLFVVSALVIAGVAWAAPPEGLPAAVYSDPAPDAAHPARMAVLHIPSGGVAINGVAYLAAGAGEHPTVGRDHEYKRLGTASILAGLDLHTGHVTARVEHRHRSREFIALLQDLDRYYPPECTLRLVLDNHSAHLSKETQAYLATRPNRFKYVLTPTHGSWLNIVETLFGKMARTFLRQMRVQSWEELRDRILLGVAEINAAPVVHRWKKFDALMT